MSTLERRQQTTIMLLGPGERFLAYRQRVKEELTIMGYNVIIMEEERQKAGDGGIRGKFARIVNDHDPDLIVAFFHDSASTIAVAYEIGFIDAHFGIRNISERLRILHEEKYDFTNTTAYIQDVFSSSSVPKIPFNENASFGKSSNIIHNCVVNMEE